MNQDALADVEMTTGVGVWTSCLAGWHPSPRYRLYSASTFRHLQTQHVWHPCCLFLLRGTEAFRDDTNNESPCFIETIDKAYASQNGTREHQLRPDRARCFQRAVNGLKVALAFERRRQRSKRNMNEREL